MNGLIINATRNFSRWRIKAQAEAPNRDPVHDFYGRRLRIRNVRGQTYVV